MEIIRRAVYRYDMKGCFEKEYPSVSAAARDNGVSPTNISFAANNGTVSAGCLWYWEKVQQLSHERLQGTKPRRAKPVLQYDTDGTLLGRYRTMREAGEAAYTSPCNISAAAKGRTRTAGGYVWRLEDAQDQDIQ